MGGGLVDLPETCDVFLKKRQLRWCSISEPSTVSLPYVINYIYPELTEVSWVNSMVHGGEIHLSHSLPRDYDFNGRFSLETTFKSVNSGDSSCDGFGLSRISILLMEENMHQLTW